jgi:chemotaxis protein MotB
VGSNDKPEILQIKKVKKGGHEHHGGAWKMAYADFVTTLMSLFLVLWLANISVKKTTSTRQECRIYRPNLKLYALYMTHPTPHDQRDLYVDGDKGPNAMYKTTERRTTPGNTTTGSQLNSDTIEQLRAQLEDHATLAVADEGLYINISPSQDDIFCKGTSVLTEHGKTVMRRIAASLSAIPNELQIVGTPDADYGGNTLAVRRAQTTEQFLKECGIPQSRIQQIVGNSHHPSGVVPDARYNSIGVVILP